MFKKKINYNEKFTLEIEPNTTQDYCLHIFGDFHILIRKITCTLLCKDITRKIFNFNACNAAMNVNICSNMVIYHSQLVMEQSFNPGQLICAHGRIDFTLRNLSDFPVKVKVRAEGLQSGKA